LQEVAKVIVKVEEAKEAKEAKGAKGAKAEAIAKEEGTIRTIYLIYQN
jgi:hypothetical protein